MVSISKTHLGTFLILKILVAIKPTIKKMQARKEFLACVAKIIGKIPSATTKYKNFFHPAKRKEEYISRIKIQVSHIPAALGL